MILTNLACVLVFSFCGFGQPSVGTVSGRVVGLGGHHVGLMGPAEVTLVGVEGAEREASRKVAKTTADFDGSFRFEGVLPGQYFLMAEYTGYASTRSCLVDVFAGEVTIVDLIQRVGVEVVSAEDMMEVSGTVRDHQGPLADATVSILFLPLPDEVRQLRTDSKGNYGPVLVTPGDQLITVLKPGYDYEIKLVKWGTKRIVDFRLRISVDD